VSFAELDQLGDLRCRHRRPVSPGRRADALSGPALVRRPGARPTTAPAVAVAPPDPAVVGAEPSGHDQTPRSGRNLCRRWRLAAGLLRGPGRARCRAVEPRCQHQRLRRRHLVGGHHHDHRRIRRPLPGHCRRTHGRLRADDRRDRPAGHCDRHPSLLVSRDDRGREGAGRGPASHGPAVGRQNRPTGRGEPPAASPEPTAEGHQRASGGHTSGQRWSCLRF
jgi:hypothetical protein